MTINAGRSVSARAIAREENRERELTTDSEKELTKRKEVQMPNVFCLRRHSVGGIDRRQPHSYYYVCKAMQ